MVWPLECRRALSARMKSEKAFAALAADSVPSCWVCRSQSICLGISGQLRCKFHKVKLRNPSKYVLG